MLGVFGLSDRTDKKKLEYMFSKYGKILDVQLIADRKVWNISVRVYGISLFLFTHTHTYIYVYIYIYIYIYTYISWILPFLLNVYGFPVFVGCLSNYLHLLFRRINRVALGLYISKMSEMQKRPWFAISSNSSI